MLDEYCFQFLSRLARCVSTNRKRSSSNPIAVSCAEILEVRVVPSAVQVTPLSGLVTTEAGGAVQFEVVLTSQPKGKVKIPIASSNPKEGVVSTKQLIFTSANWAAPQSFTVKGVDDLVTDGDNAYDVVLGKFKSRDKVYKALTPITQAITNTDDDIPGVKITAGNNLTTTEAGGAANFSVKLGSQPTSNVVIPFQSSNTAEGTVTSSITFTPKNWNQSQTVKITGVNDSTIDGNQGYQVIFGTTQSLDQNYAGLTADPISLTNLDDDTAGVVVSPSSISAVNEGSSKNFAFRLTAQPAADVTVTLTVIDGLDQATLSNTTLTFTPVNWKTSQNVAVSGLLGDGIDGNQLFRFDIDTVSDDSLFNLLPTQTVAVTIRDSEAPAPTLDGNYSGIYSGSISTFGFSQSVSGNIEASVVGNTFTMTQPISLTKTLPGDGTVNIFLPISAAAFSGVTFTGDTVENPDGSVTVSGSWSITKLGVHGGGTWSITRAPLA